LSARLTRLAALIGVADNVFTLLMVVGAVSALAGWFPGIYLVLAGFGGHLAGHLLVGVAGYRDVMSRPWPQVSPLDDDDDW
jgi:hypothetical protein